MPTETLSPVEVLGLLQPPKRSKYGVAQGESGRASRTLDGIVYDSAAERDYAATLNIMQKCGKIHSYERQVRIPLLVNDRLIKTMVIDFRVRWPDGRTQLVDVKGFVTPEWRLAAKLFEALHGYAIIEVKAGGRA